MTTLEFQLPDIGEGVHEGEIVRWIVAEGATVNEDDPIVEVMTDKATVEIPAPASGTVSKHLFAEGDVANVGDVIFTLERGAGGAAPAAAPVEEAAPVAVAPTPAPEAAPAAGGGLLEFRLPDIGEGVHEGEIVQWIVQEGATIAEDDPIVEVMTDKATVEIPAPAAGVLQSTLVGEGEVAKVGDVIFTIATSGGGAAPVAAPAAAPIAAPIAAPATNLVPADPSRKVLAAPATRRLGRELNVDLTTINGSGPNGRIKPEDVRAAASAGSAPVAAPAVPAAPAAPVAAPAAAAPAAAPVAALPGFPSVMGAREVKEVPFRGIRRKTAEAMVRSKFTATHFSLIEEVDCTEMMEARTKAKKVAERYGIKVTYMGYIMKATAMALTEYPQLNAELDEEAGVIKQKHYVNLGIAVDTPNGLMVPVIKDANLKNILQLSADLMDIAARARSGKLKPADFSDSTFSITNAGSIGGVFATPIINFPEAAIMGVHSMRKMPRCKGDDIVAATVMNLSISIDHRIVDGADGARFMVRVRDLLEDPTLMLL
ncbi:MAG: 2-oxo acid dehydrogenase subunit E2 [Planctomycetota bacterium]|nr:2-oxo acid dehydrogenase subunit E2 [Planctomycetota bacterium]